jgi:hypothetical protein
VLRPGSPMASQNAQPLAGREPSPIAGSKTAPRGSGSQDGPRRSLRGTVEAARCGRYGL